MLSYPIAAGVEPYFYDFLDLSKIGDLSLPKDKFPTQLSEF